MNKKLLFATLSLAALASCSNDDFESQQQLAEGQTCPVKFEVLNNNAQTRAYMDGNTLRWEASKGDLFTLYHGVPTDASDITKGYWNAAYKAETNGEAASLSTPTMIKEGYAVMFWPVDTTFRIKTTDALTIKIPAEQNPVKEKGSVEDFIPYVSDLVEILPYNDKAPYNTAGKDRKYSVFMRPMASQLNLKADYAGTDDQIATLYKGGSEGLSDEEAIDPIKVTSIDLLTKETGSSTPFTTEVPVKFVDPSTEINGRWTASKTSNHNNWKKVTALNVAGIAPAGQTNKLTTTCLNGNDGCKFVILPQAEMTTAGTGVDEAAVVVNTIYGKVVVAPNGVQGSKYEDSEAADAWYRFLSEKPVTDEDGETTASTKETSGPGEGKYKTTSKPEFGMKQTLNLFYNKTATKDVVEGEPVGANVTRYVKVLLKHLDMSDLHIKNDKQLRDVARVWKKLDVAPVTVYLDGDAKKEFKISQKTIEVINQANDGTLNFKVMPCQKSGEECNTIVITGSDYKQDVQDIAFITNNGGTKAAVALADEGTAKPWKWNGIVKVASTGVVEIRNNGTMENAATATLKITENDGTANNTTKLVNNKTWNVNGATTVLNVKFDVDNNGTVTIAEGAQYRQDGTGHIFVNQASDKPARFNGDDTKIGVVNNNGVFATVDNGEIYNYGGLIEHLNKDAKTYITKNEEGGSFTTAFSSSNRMGRINLPFSNKEEDNVSISAALNKGFVSVTVSAADAPTDGILNAAVVGNKVNYVIVNGGIKEIAAVSDQVKYLEIYQPRTEIVWNVPATTVYDGLMILSDVNIKLGTKIIATTTYLGADMYVGGKFNIAAIAAEGTDPAYTATSFSGYYGDTSGNVATKYITY